MGIEPAIDITAEQRKTVLSLLEKHLPNTTAWVYGSRAKWTSRPQSDLDMVVFATPEQSSQVFGLREAFEESNLPFRVDLFVWDDVSERFRKHIKQDYVVLVEGREDGMESEWRETVYGRFSSDFVEDCLMDLCDEIDGVQTGPFGSQLHKRDYVSSGTPIITVEHLGENRILHRDLPQVSTHDRERLSKYSLQKGDIVFSRVGSVDRRALVRESENGWLFSGRCLRVRTDPNKIDSTYLSYFFGLPSFKEHVRAIAVGATMPSLNTKILSDIVIPHPCDLNEQRAIAHILGTLDDKIELNRRMNETLEEMARALFKSWFVDFDPIRAKMEGWDTGLPPDVVDLFPNRLVDSELGEIPEGWEVKTIGDLCHKPQYGYTASAKDKHVGPKFLRITDINKQAWIDWDSVPYCEITEENFDKYRLYKGDVLIARMADPGHGVMIEESQEVVFASYLIRFCPIHERHTRLLQYWLRSDGYWKLVSERGAGTTRASLNAKVLSKFPLVVPSVSVADAFEGQIASLRARVIVNASESRTLTALRDTLLPKLVAGELRMAHKFYGPYT